MCFCFSSLPDFFSLSFFFFNDTATTEIYTLSLHDALPIFCQATPTHLPAGSFDCTGLPAARPHTRSEEHTSELQSHSDLVCRLLLEKKKKKHKKQKNELNNKTTKKTTRTMTSKVQTYQLQA